MEIQGYNNYLIYPDGRVFSKFGKGRFLKHLSDGVYNFVQLCNNGKCEIKPKVHRLVAIHYIPNPDNKSEVDHIDRNPLNNDVSNLRWVTALENSQNKGMSKNNTTGHKNIYYQKKNDSWRYAKTYNYLKYQKEFNSKIDCLCYKYIMTLRLKTASGVSVA
tara:strand:+ start:2668 stop:3150 length:483 start_codon:yes stop_codon:yes gene_type:complete